MPSWIIIIARRLEIVAAKRSEAAAAAVEVNRSITAQAGKTEQVAEPSSPSAHTASETKHDAPALSHDSVSESHRSTAAEKSSSDVDATTTDLSSAAETAERSAASAEEKPDTITVRYHFEHISARYSEYESAILLPLATPIGLARAANIRLCCVSEALLLSDDA